MSFSADAPVQSAASATSGLVVSMLIGAVTPLARIASNAGSTRPNSVSGETGL